MSNLDVKISADVVDLQTKMSVAKAEVQAYSAELRKLAQQSAAGLLDPAGQAQLQQAADDFLHAKAAAAELSAQMKELHESSGEAFGGIGEAVQDIRGKISSAFEFTGIAVAIEAIRSVGETISELGERATQIHSMSDLLGITVEQFQAMQQAAEEGGVGIEVFVRASEQLLNFLTEARSGSAAAIDKLLALGFSIKEIQDPTFKLNDALGSLNARLRDSSTEEETRAELMHVLGLRTAQAALAFIHYAATAEDVAEKNRQVNALNKEQTDHLHEAALAMKDLGERSENTLSKMILGLTRAGQWLQENLRGARQLAEFVGAPAPEARKSQAVAVGTIDRGQSQEQSAQQQQALDRQIAQQELENIKAGVAAYKDGTAEKLAQLKEYAAAAQAYYGGSEVDAVKKAQEEVISETRRFNEERKRQIDELANYAEKLDERVTKEKIRGQEELIAHDLRVNQEEAKALEDLANYAQELDTRVTKEHAQVLQEMNRITQQQARAQMQAWKFLTDGMRNGFQQAITGILQGTESFGDAMRNIFTSVLDAIIGELSEWAAEWITKLLLAKFTNQATAASQISANAGVAATAAMASVAAIPFYGWAMAPGVGAATAAEALSFESLAAAEQGWDVPGGAGVYPTLLHPNEMVLPAPIANAVRQSAQQQRGGDMGRTVHIHASSRQDTVTVDQLAVLFKQAGMRFKLS